MLAKLFGNLFRPRDGAGGSCAEFLQRAEAMVKAGQLNAALEVYRECMLAYPQSLDACLGAAGTLADLWAMDEAAAMYECAWQLAPASGVIYSALLFHRHYRSPVDTREMFRAHRRFGEMMRGAVPPAGDRFTQSPDAERRLRIGYVSPNFSRHSVGYFIEPVLRCHDRERYEVFCYYSHPQADDATARMRGLADGWRDIAGVADDAVERAIRDDKIDILFDLAGHTKGNRLGVFSRRAAPVQMTWLGYPDTSGLAGMDCRITDGTADPAPAAEERHTESLLRMADCFLCYQPPPDAPAATPREAAGAVVFSSFNNIAKLNDETLRLWAQILAAVPASRLALKASTLNYPDTVDRLLDSCERAGIDTARVELRGWIADRQQHLELYNEIDIALDTCPYNGTTTTCEALWMGVPVVTLAGEVHMSRVGATLLRSARLEDLVAHSSAEYVDIAVALAGNVARRHSLRAGLRARLQASPLLDHAGFTRQLEAHCRGAWGAWCERQCAG